MSGINSKPSDLENLMNTIQRDLTAVKTNLAELQRQIASLQLEPATRHICPRCGVQRPSAQLLQEHLELLHDQPVEA